ncbi:MAG: hypothetical protein HYV51_02170 [Parcubacteria group bacterium]|nr:hypothetical protein [Parcubacteria group bacterium]
MRRIRGIKDIKTHGTLAREGRLVSVARDWHKIGRSGSTEGSSENQFWDGSVKHMVFKKSAETRRPSRGLFQDIALEKKIQAARIAQIQESIAEMEMFASEGMPGGFAELERLKIKLSQLESV